MVVPPPEDFHGLKGRGELTRCCGVSEGVKMAPAVPAAGAAAGATSGFLQARGHMGRVRRSPGSGHMGRVSGGTVGRGTPIGPIAPD